ncbi:hypothetical protein NL676_039112 [Syzygium grande]|nr:hypothetical protein NL676_039112 [Syzygium grande]
MGYLLDNAPKGLQGLQLLLTNFTDALEIRLQDSRQEELVSRTAEETSRRRATVGWRRRGTAAAMIRNDSRPEVWL